MDFRNDNSDLFHGVSQAVHCALSHFRRLNSTVNGGHGLICPRCQRLGVILNGHHGILKPQHRRANCVQSSGELSSGFGNPDLLHESKS